MRIRISDKAFEDIEGIWLYTLENWSLEQADRYYNLLYDEIEYLAKNPLSGKDFGSVRKGYRYSMVKSHLILYRIKTRQNELEIVRVLHQRMDIENQLNQ